jgi:hypothetical protein
MFVVVPSEAPGGLRALRSAGGTPAATVTVRCVYPHEAVTTPLLIRPAIVEIFGLPTRAVASMIECDARTHRTRKRSARTSG